MNISAKTELCGEEVKEASCRAQRHGCVEELDLAACSLTRAQWPPPVLWNNSGAHLLPAGLHSGTQKDKGKMFFAFNPPLIVTISPVPATGKQLTVQWCHHPASPYEPSEE